MSRCGCIYAKDSIEREILITVQIFWNKTCFSFNCQFRCSFFFVNTRNWMEQVWLGHALAVSFDPAFFPTTHSLPVIILLRKIIPSCCTVAGTGHGNHHVQLNSSLTMHRLTFPTPRFHYFRGQTKMHISQEKNEYQNSKKSFLSFFVKYFTRVFAVSTSLL